MQLPGAYRRRLFWLTATCHTRVYNFARTALSPSLPRHAGLAAPWTSKARHAVGPMHLLLLPYTYFLAEMLSSLPHSTHVSVQITSLQTDRLTTHYWETVRAPNTLSLPCSTFPHKTYHPSHKLYKYTYLPFALWS